MPPPAPKDKNDPEAGEVLMPQYSTGRLGPYPRLASMRFTGAREQKKNPPMERTD